MAFSDIIESFFHGAYEECYYSEPSENKNYKAYRYAVKKDFVQLMQDKYNSLQL